MQEKEKESILQRIKEDDLKAEKIKEERAEILKVRNQMRIEADLMKAEMKEYFEKLQNKQASLERANEIMETFSLKFQEKLNKLKKMSSPRSSPQKK